MKNTFKHFRTITKHKYYVMIECFKRGLYWQGLIHDLSKYSLTEFVTSAKYFQGDKTPIGAEKRANGYSKAWLHHKAHNKHHWEYWVDFKNGELLLCPIPDRYVKEMVCDMIGASKAYLKEEFNKREPYNFFMKNKDNMLMEDGAKRMLEILLKCYDN